MAKDILKEAIADAKAVREVALANAKAALEEAFTPKLQSMLSAKLSEELEDEDLDMDEMITYDEDEDMDEMHGDMYDEDMTYEDEEENLEMGETYGEKDEMDEEIDLEEILNELELEEGDEEEEEDLDEVHKPHYEASDVNLINPSADKSNLGYVHEDKEFDLDALLKEINELEDEEELFEIEDDEMEPTTEFMKPHGKFGKFGPWDGNPEPHFPDTNPWDENPVWWEEQKSACGKTLTETREALKTVRNELNEVNLLNSKLLYVNRIFKANNLDDPQKLRVVETLDKAESIKEAKLIYETIKDTFTISTKDSKKTPKKSLRENFGMASKASKSTAPTKPILKESNEMVTRMQKLANITIKE